MHTNFVVTVKFQGDMSNEGGDMTHQFFSQGLRVTVTDYKKVVERVVRLWIESVSKGRLFTVSQGQDNPRMDKLQPLYSCHHKHMASQHVAELNSLNY